MTSHRIKSAMAAVDVQELQPSTTPQDFNGNPTLAATLSHELLQFLIQGGRKSIWRHSSNVEQPFLTY